MTTRLEDLKPDALAKGLLAGDVVRIVSAEMLGDAACRVVYRGQDGALGEQLLFRTSETTLELVSGGRKWSFAGDAFASAAHFSTRVWSWIQRWPSNGCHTARRPHGHNPPRNQPPHPAPCPSLIALFL